MKAILSFAIVCLTAGCTALPQDYTAGRLIGTSENNQVAEWRRREGIPENALLAVYPDGRIAIVENPTRIRYIGPSLSPYVNDFVQCYLNMEGEYRGEPVVLQAPCSRDPERFRTFGMGGVGTGGFGLGFGLGFGW